MNAILGGDVKLSVLINEQPNLYFLPGSITSIGEVPERIHDEIRNGEKKYLAEPGKYEICGIGFVIQELETIYNEVMAPGKTLQYYRSKLLTISQIMSAEGVKGILVENIWEGLHGNNDLSFARIPFTRILVEQVSNPDLADLLKASGEDEHEPELIPNKNTRNTPLKLLMMRYFDETNGRDDFRECFEFMLKDPEVDEDGDGRIWYMSFSKKPQTPLISSVRKSFNKYRKEWLSLNQ